MKQLLQLIKPFREMRKIAAFSFVLFALLAIPMGMKGQTIGEASLTWSVQNLANQTNVDETAYNLGDYFTVTCTKNGASTPPTYYTSGTAVRCYATKNTNNGNVITVAKKAGVTNVVYITKVEYNGEHNKKGTTSFTYSGNPTSTTDTSASYDQSEEVTSASATLCETGGTTNGQFYFTSVKVEYVVVGDSPSPTTYTVTFDAGDGTFIGNTDFPSVSNTIVAGTYTLPSAERSGYTFDGWLATGSTTPVTGSYTVSGDVDFTAQYTESTPLPDGTDVLNWVATGEPSNSYIDWTYTAPSGAVYVGQSAGNYQSIQLRSNNENSGIVTTVSAGRVTSISVDWNTNTANGRTLNVYGKNTAYTAATDLYGNNAGTLIGTIVCGTSTELNIAEEYEYIGLRSNSSAMYLDEIRISWESVTPAVVAAPTFDPVSGTEFGNEGLSVTISCETEDAEIFYTLDGTTPDNTSASYSAPISLATTTTVKAIAYDGTDYSNVATATYTYVDPNAPGTENNPYTVDQARAAIDAGTGTQGVYATGIVSEIVTPYNSQFGNITYNISADGQTTSDQLQAYRGKSYNGVNFSSANDIQVGATVVVYGNLKLHTDGTYEFEANNELVSYIAPIVAVEAPTFSPVAGTYAEAQNVTISCATNGATIYYTTDGTEPTNESDQYTEAISVTEYTTIKAVAYLGTESSTVASATYHFCSADNPYTVTEALAFNEYPANEIYVHGIVSTAPTSLSNGTLTYYISVDGEATNQLEVYKGKDLENQAFTSVDDIQVGDIVTVYGNVQVYSGTIEFGSGNYLVSFERPVVPSITISNTSLNVGSDANTGSVEVIFANLTDEQIAAATAYLCDANGETATYDWITVSMSTDAVTYTINSNEGQARTAYFRVCSDELCSDIVIVNQAAYVAPPEPGDWVLTDLADLSENDVFVIVGTYEDVEHDSYAMANNKGTSSAPVAVSVTVLENKLVGEIADSIQWNISGNATAGYIFYPNGDDATWLYCTNTNNGVRVGTGDAKHFTLSAEGYLTTTETTDQRYIGVYNTQDWRCYKLGNDGSFPSNIAGQSFAFYKKVASTDCEKISLTAPDYTWSEDFEGYPDADTVPRVFTFVQPDCWTVAHEFTSPSINHVGDEADTLPQLYRAFNHTDGGRYSLRMKYRCILAMPELSEDIDLERLHLQMYVRQPQNVYKLQVGLMTNLNEPNSFVPVAVVNNNDKNMNYFECGFKSAIESLEEGYEHLYIAFRNFGGSSTDKYCSNYLDDITLTYVDEDMYCTIPVPYTQTFENFPNIANITNSEGAIGVEPECWEVITADAALTSTTKPQLYAGYNMTDGALSSDGNYTLRMKNRCVYAMPELEAGVDIHDLTMTFSLLQGKKVYRLQVGVLEADGTFTPVDTFNLPEDNPVQKVTVDFADYDANGTGRRIAFRNTVSNSATIEYSTNFIDDIEIKLTSEITSEGDKVEGGVIDAMNADILEDIMVYPNPTTGELHIDAMGVQKVECYNQMGQLVGVYDNADLDLGSLANGVYMLRITVPQGVTMRKVVKR